MISVIHGKKQRLPRRNRSSTLLIVNYESGCEPHATNFGGAVIFEQKEGATVFRGYQPGFQANDCITLARNGKQDRLICITGHLGQGHLESGVAEMVFTRDFSKTIDVSLNYFVRAEDATGAYGSNVVDCKETSVYFGLAKLGAGPGAIPSPSISPTPTRIRSRPHARKVFPARRRSLASLDPARPMSRPAMRRRQGS
jgi:hypothetical protein